MRKIERRVLDGSDTYVVLDVLQEVAHREVTAFTVVPLKREIIVLRFQRLQAGVTLLTGAAVDTNEAGERLSTLDVTPALFRRLLTCRQTR